MPIQYALFENNVTGDPAPVDPSELAFLATDPRTPYVAAFDGAHADNATDCTLHRGSTRGEAGPWSETAPIYESAAWIPS